MYHAILFIAGLLIVRAGPEQARVQDHALDYRCNDLVVTGRIKNGDWEHVEIADDLLGHGWASAILKIRKHIHGMPRNSVMQVRYFGHTYLREDRDFMFVLTKADDGRYEIRGWKLMSAHPRIAQHCT